MTWGVEPISSPGMRVGASHRHRSQSTASLVSIDFVVTLVVTMPLAWSIAPQVLHLSKQEEESVLAIQTHVIRYQTQGKVSSQTGRCQTLWICRPGLPNSS